MSKCICGVCPSTFKFSTDEEAEEFLCLVEEEQLYMEARICKEQIEKMIAVALIRKGSGEKPLTAKEKKFIEYNTSYWKSREEIINNEMDRRKK